MPACYSPPPGFPTWSAARVLRRGAGLRPHRCRRHHLSSLRLFGLGTLQGDQAVTAVLLAVLANVAFKSGLATAIGGAALARQVLPGMAAVAAGLVAGWLLL